MKKSVIFFLLIFFIVISLSIIQVVISNTLSTVGVGLGKLEEEISFYNKENSILKEKILSKSSLSSIAVEAEKIGFVEEQSSFFLTVPLPLAVKQ